MKFLSLLIISNTICFLLFACASKQSIIKTEKLAPVNVDSLIFRQKKSAKPKILFVHGSNMLPKYPIEVKSLTMLNTKENIIEAEVIGGKEAIVDRIIYPELSKRAQLEGTVALEFDVDTLGAPQNISIIKGIGGTCEEAAVYAIESVCFKPARQYDKPIITRYRLVLLFKIPKEFKKEYINYLNKF